MCGIFGYVGFEEAISIGLKGIKHLEYRGYDSAGLAAIIKETGELVFCKEVGKVIELEKTVNTKDWHSNLAIAHTRWATHGRPSERNAHPHFDENMKVAVVHNGIIENYSQIKEMLSKSGVTFRSETDSEVISQLIGQLYEGDFLHAVQQAVSILQGAFAIAVIHHNHPDQIICVAKDSPLAIGLGHGENFIASDSQAFLKYTKRAIYLSHSEIAVIKAHSVETYDASFHPIVKPFSDIDIDIDEVSKGSFEHYMLKEIHEQVQTVENALLSRYSLEFGTAILDELNISDEELLGIKRVLILACGSSWHAGLVAAYMIEEKARIPVQVEISSEFRYKNPIVQPDTLAITISQSGETADTVAALRELKEKGAKVIGICNAQGSTIAREAHSCIFLRAGPEIGVASTKAFTSQLIALSLLTLKLARMRIMSLQEGKEFLNSLIKLPEQIQRVLEQEKVIEKIAQKYAGYENFFFLGRRYMYPTALEGALKLKEIAYINANAYPAGEMKHGPIALINEKCPTVAFCCDKMTYQKMISNLKEVQARSGPVFAITEENLEDIKEIAEDIFFIPSTEDTFSPILATIVSQLFSYYVALTRGTEIDQPRNLAKSVTVE